MNFKQVFGIAVFLLLGVVAIAMTGIWADDQAVATVDDENTLSNTAEINRFDHRSTDSEPVVVASEIDTNIDVETISTTIELVRFLERDNCDQCSQPANQCGCQNNRSNSKNGVTCSACGGSANSGGCNCGQDGRGRMLRRQSELIPVASPPIVQAPGPVRAILGVDENVCNRLGREPGFQDSQMVPWEMFAYGEYIGPHRTPHVPEYRLRVNDSLEFVYYLWRKQTVTPYQIFVGDVIRISSATDPTIDQPQLTVLSDGTLSLPLIGQVRAAGKTIADLQDELNDLYLEYLNDPSVLVQVIDGDTPLDDVIRSVDATQGVGGQVSRATVSPDGTVQLPVIGSIPAVGLSLDEIRREINARYREKVSGLNVTPVLTQRAPRFIYVLGQVTTPGRFELVGPTTVMQAIALAQGDLQGGNLRNIVIFRRDEQWRLTATRLDLAGAVLGKRPFPSDEMFLRDSDIILIPRKPIQRLSEAVDLYLTRTLYGIFPRQVVFDFDNLGSF